MCTEIFMTESEGCDGKLTRREQGVFILPCERGLDVRCQKIKFRLCGHTGERDSGLERKR